MCGEYRVLIRWGFPTSPYREEYTFSTEVERAAFIKGVQEAVKWDFCTILEPKEYKEIINADV